MPQRDLSSARRAYQAQDVNATIAAHTVPRAYEKHATKGQYLKSAVYGGLDGTITTFAVVAGVAGASLSTGVLLILGFANLVGDGLSMAIGDYLSSKSENEYQGAERRREEWEVDHYPEGEKKELVDLYIEKGLPIEDAETVVNIIAKNRKAWVDIMMVEELGIVQSDESPMKNAATTFVSFSLFGLVPVAAFVLSGFFTGLQPYAFTVASCLTGLTLFTLGALKTRLTERNWILSGLEMLLVGGIAAGAAYGIGVALEGLAK